MVQTFVLAKIAALRFKVGKATGKFSVRLTSKTNSILSNFEGSGDVELNEETIELADGDVIEVSVLDSNDALIHRVDVPLANLQGQSDWSILQQEDFEIRIQFLVTTRVPKDAIENALEILAGPRAWYLKAEDLYALLKTAVSALNLPTGNIAENASRLVDVATEAVVNRFTPLTTTEEIHVLQTVDHILATQCTVFDQVVDSSRFKLVQSLRRLRAGLEASVERNTAYAQQLAETAVAASRDISNKATETVNTSVETAKVAVTASVENAKATVAARVEDAKATTTASIDQAKTRVNALSEESKKWATDFLSARIIQAKDVLSKAQPFVVQAVDASQPYAVKAAAVAEPYVNLARPYVEPVIAGALKLAEENKYVGSYVAPILGHASHALSEAKSYCGVGDNYFGAAIISDTTVAQVDGNTPVETH